MSESAPGDWIGDRFQLREGPLPGGNVWLAHDERMRREVVRKRLADDEPFEPQAMAMAMARINHQHVITVYDYLSLATGGGWLVMEYAPQGSLAGNRAWLRTKQRGSARRSRARWRTCTPRGSCTATSSPPTSCWPRTVPPS